MPGRPPQLMVSVQWAVISQSAAAGPLRSPGAPVPADRSAARPVSLLWDHRQPARGHRRYVHTVQEASVGVWHRGAVVGFRSEGVKLADCAYF